MAHALADLPKTSDALRRGQISYSKVRAITRVATAATEDRLLHLARQATAADLERIVRAWRRCDRQHEGREDAKRRRDQGLSIYPDVDGMFVVRGLLTPEVGAVVRRAIEAASEQLYQEAKDAEPKNVEAALEETGGIRVSAETSRRIACDAGKVVMRHDAEGNVLDVGRKTRTIPPALRRALASRDQHCRFPGCEARRCDAHHVKHWADGGATKLDNLVLLCRPPRRI